MYTSVAATAAARSAYSQIAASLVAAIEGDAKTPWEIARDAGIVYGDLLQFLGANGNAPAEPYTSAKKTCSLEFAAMVARGLTDPTPFTIALGFEMSPTSGTLTPGTHAVAHGGITFNLVNGIAPKSYAVISGTIPTAMVFDTSAGTLTGTPSTAATYNFTVEGTDRNGNKSRRAYSMVIA